MTNCSDIREANLHRNRTLVRFVELYSNRFVYNYLRSGAGQQVFAMNMPGSSQALFNLTSPRELRVPKPDSAEQSQLAERCDASDLIISTNKFARRRLLELKTALMQVVH